jgi:RHS repeat-associated protein
VTRSSPPDSKIIYYVGELYEEHVYGSARIRKCFIRVGNRVIAIRNAYHDGSSAIEYLHRDHLNSVDVLTDGSGAVLERTSFDAFGKRRPSNWTSDPNDVYTNERLYRTARGYTGHEHLDNVGLIHMNGRVYDPALGRFTSPDPFVQFPESTQGLNRYSYVNNNPLSYTDPSGYFLEEILVAIALIVIGEAADIPILTQIGFTLLCYGCNWIAASATGFAGGLISSDGDIRQAVISGITAGASSFANGYFSELARVASDGTLTAAQTAAKIITHGTIGGASSELSGGKFSEGFLSQGFATGAAELGLTTSLGGDSPVGRTIATAVVGGTAAELGGGKFANGASTAAFLQATAEAADYFEKNVGGKATLRPGENRSSTDFAVDPNTGQQLPEDRAINAIGLNRQLGSVPGFKGGMLDLGTQGGPISRILNLFPGASGAFARTHDFWLNPVTGLEFNLVTNFGTMVPAAAVGYGAVIGNVTQGWQNNPMVWRQISQDQNLRNRE